MSSASSSTSASASARDTSHLAKLSLPNIIIDDFLNFTHGSKLFVQKIDHLAQKSNFSVLKFKSNLLS